MTSKWKVIIRHSNWTTKRWHKYHGCDSTVNFSKSNSPWTIYTAHIYVHWIGCSMYTVSISHTKWTESLSHINVMPFCVDIWAIAMQRRISRKFDFLLCTLLFSRRSFSVSPNHATSETCMPHHFLCHPLAFGRILVYIRIFWSGMLFIAIFFSWLVIGFRTHTHIVRCSNTFYAHFRFHFARFRNSIFDCNLNEEFISLPEHVKYEF